MDAPISSHLLGGHLILRASQRQAPWTAAGLGYPQDPLQTFLEGTFLCLPQAEDRGH